MLYSMTVMFSSLLLLLWWKFRDGGGGLIERRDGRGGKGFCMHGKGLGI